MPWARLDDQLWLNPKIRALNDRQLRLWLYGLSYCANQLTDGIIDSDGLRSIALAARINRAKRVATALVEAGLWEDVNGAYLVHDYLDYNPTKAQVQAEREANAKRKRRQRHAGTSSGTPAESPAGSPRSPIPNPIESPSVSSSSSPYLTTPDDDDDIPTKLSRIGWNDHQVDAALSDPERAMACVAQALGTPTVANIAAYSWTLFSSGDDPRSPDNELQNQVRTWIDEHGYPTGSRMARGASSGTYVNDPLGHDLPPYPVEWGKPTFAEVTAALLKHGLVSAP